MPERYWVYYTQMQFLREQIAPRKTISNINESNQFVDASLDISDESFIDFSDSPMSTQLTETSSSELPSTSKRKRRSNSGDLNDFLKKMSNIAEKRFCLQGNELLKEAEKHKGFFNGCRFF